MSSVNSGVSERTTGHLPVSRSVSQTLIDDDTLEPVASCTGRVKWFNDQKGFGFICDDDGRDIFVHYAVIEGEGFKTLSDGETVQYEYVDGPKGRRATRVVRDSVAQAH